MLLIHVNITVIHYINYILNYFFNQFKQCFHITFFFYLIHSLATLTSFSNMPMNVLVIHLVTVLLIDSSFTSLQILNPYALLFIVLSKFSIKSRIVYNRSFEFPGMNSKHGTCQNVRYISSVRPPVEQRGSYRTLGSTNCENEPASSFFRNLS